MEHSKDAKDRRGAQRTVASLILPFALGVGLIVSGVLFGLSLGGRAAMQGDTGAHIISQGSMSDEEAQAMLDEMAEASRITISLAPEMVLGENGSLRVNLVVPESNNGLSERIEIEQDGTVVYQSGEVEPGCVLEWGANSSAHVGPATATVYAQSGGSDFGNPVSVEVEVIER